VNGLLRVATVLLHRSARSLVTLFGKRGTGRPSGGPFGWHRSSIRRRL